MVLRSKLMKWLLPAIGRPGHLALNTTEHHFMSPTEYGIWLLSLPEASLTYCLSLDTVHCQPAQAGVCGGMSVRFHVASTQDQLSSSAASSAGHAESGTTRQVSHLHCDRCT